jgi:hypothetical protein
MNPGDWAWRDFASQGSASARASLLKKKGFEATARGVRLYARWPKPAAVSMEPVDGSPMLPTVETLKP